MTTKKTKTELQAIEDLSCDCIDTKPRTVDWNDVKYGDVLDEFSWMAWSAETCEGCNKTLVIEVNCGDQLHSDVEAPGDSSCDGHVPSFEGPMMNYFYPFDMFSDDEHINALAEKLVGLPLCLVRLGEVLGLALTGGGMDLSWEICEAYMRLGYLPPTHFEMPDMCGRGLSEKDRWIISGYVHACQVQARWLERRRERALNLGRTSDGIKPLIKPAKKDGRRGFKEKKPHGQTRGLKHFAKGKNP